MVAPADLGTVAARLLTVEADHEGLRHVEGPARYSPADVARAFSQALGRDVRALETPRSEWVGAFKALGFSAVAVASYARMTAVTLDEPYEPAEAPERGLTTLVEYVAALVGQGAAKRSAG